MPLSFKLFNFQGSPVYLKLWFFLLLIFLSPLQVFIIFLSILTHEIAHALMANLKGYKVYNIYIDMLNGAAEMDLNNIPERDSIPIILAGPVSNLILSICSFTLLLVFPSSQFLLSFLIINFVLFAFNILPIYPMDGGRILRDYLTMKMRSNRYKAKMISASISLIFSLALFAFSIYSFNMFSIIFSLVFIYFAIKDLGWINK